MCCMEIYSKRWKGLKHKGILKINNEKKGMAFWGGY